MIRKIIICLIALLLLGFIVYLYIPVKTNEFKGKINAYNAQIDTYDVIAQVPACGDGSQNFGPWCHISCVGETNPFYKLCKVNGYVIKFKYQGHDRTALCPKGGANYFEASCQSVLIN